MAVIKRKHESPEAEPSGALRALSEIVKGGFVQSEYTDFEISCGERSFHVHKMLMEKVEYFGRAINGQWPESRNNAIRLEGDDPEVVEVLLSCVYGEDYNKLIIKKSGRPTSDIKIPNAMYGETELEEYTPYLEADSSAFSLNDQRRADIAWDKRSSQVDQAVADHFCKELDLHVRVAQTAQFYCMTKIWKEAERHARGILNDCWFSAKVLDTISFLFTQDTNIDDDDDTRTNHLAIELVKRFSLYIVLLASLRR